jgi:hypothetical protein
MLGSALYLLVPIALAQLGRCCLIACGVARSPQADPGSCATASFARCRWRLLARACLLARARCLLALVRSWCRHLPLADACSLTLSR